MEGNRDGKRRELKERIGEPGKDGREEMRDRGTGRERQGGRGREEGTGIFVVTVFINVSHLVVKRPAFFSERKDGWLKKNPRWIKPVDRDWRVSGGRDEGRAEARERDGG